MKYKNNRMRVSELIAELEKIKESKGNIIVQVFDCYTLKYEFKVETYRNVDTDEITVALEPVRWLGGS